MQSLRDLWIQVYGGLVELGRELRRTETVAVLAVTLVLVLRWWLGYSPSGQGVMQGLWARAASFAPVLVHPVWQRQVLAVALQLLVPLALIGLVHRQRLSDFGLGPGKWRLWVPLSAVILLVQVAVVLLVLRHDPAYVRRYPSFALARAGGALFWSWEASRLLYMLSWEFLFRGYLLFALERRIGHLALAVQTVPFVLWHIVGAKPASEVFFTVASGLLSGLLALVCRSVWPLVLLHALGAILLDLVLVYGR